jgi:hypothetical protein
MTPSSVPGWYLVKVSRRIGGHSTHPEVTVMPESLDHEPMVLASTLGWWLREFVAVLQVTAAAR